MKSVVLVALNAYKRFLSPMLPTACRYVPSCSEYAIVALERHGVMRGSWMALGRFLRCNPWGGHGYDPVMPEQISAAEHRCCQLSK